MCFDQSASRRQTATLGSMVRGRDIAQRRRAAACTQMRCNLSCTFLHGDLSVVVHCQLSCLWKWSVLMPFPEAEDLETHIGLSGVS